jgi:hypothetical protein
LQQNYNRCQPNIDIFPRYATFSGKGAGIRVGRSAGGEWFSGEQQARPTPLA